MNNKLEVIETDLSFCLCDLMRKTDILVIIGWNPSTVSNFFWKLGVSFWAHFRKKVRKKSEQKNFTLSYYDPVFMAQNFGHLNDFVNGELNIILTFRNLKK